MLGYPSEGMNMEDSLDGFRPPRQARSRKTLKRIATATTTLLEERSAERVTVHEIVERADASVGAFYARFDSKEDALAYIRHQFWGEAAELWRDFLSPTRWHAVPTSSVVAEVIRRFARSFLRPERRSRAFLLEALRGSNQGITRRLCELDRHIAKEMARILASRSEDLAGDEAQLVAERAFPAVLGAIRDHLLFDPSGSPAAERELVLGLVQMYGSAVGVPRVPRDYDELLRLCSAASRVRM